MRSIICLMLLAACWEFASAQETSVYTDPDADYKKGIELLQQEKFNAAQGKFREAIDRIQSGRESTSHELLINALYYDAYCSAQLNRPDAEKLFTDLVSNYEENPTTRRAYFQLGNIYFDQKKYSKSISWYKKTDPADLSADERTQYSFRFATCYFYQKDFAKAKPLFEKLKDDQNEYYYPSNYYYGYIAYRQGNFNSALSAFRIAGQSELYKPVIPYYLANIDFMNGKYDEVIAEALTLAGTSSPYQLDMQHLIGKAYFAKQQYEKALPYFTAYLSGTGKVSKIDLYEIGFCQYQTKHYDDAIASLQQLNVSNDSLGQNAMYLVGDCYLKTNRRNEARLAFENASKMDADAFVKEQSSFQFAKLSHELNYHDVSVKALQQFIAAYPKSSHTEDAKRFLTLEFLTTNNYGEALEVLRTIPAKTPESRKAYQKVAYAHATELYNEKKYREAMNLLDESLKNPVDAGLQAAAYFWKGEASYNLAKYDSSAAYHDQFLDLAKPKTIYPANVTIANSEYTLGYCYLKQEDYDKAFSHFNKVKSALASSPGDQNKKIYSDAVLRCGDCQFALHNYSAASSNYDLVINKKTGGTDYALYQKAIILGLKNNTTDKISVLRRITSEFPSSIYVDDAWYELGVSYLSVPSYQDAAQAFNQIINKYPSSSYVVKAHLKLGLIYYNLDNDAEALKQYQWVLTKYPKTADGAEALNGVKEIYTGKGDAQGYLNFVQGLPNVNVSDAVKDSVVYLAAESKYSKGDCNGAVNEFNSYLKNFPQGAFATSAHFYRGECLFRQNDFNNALKDYEFVADQPQNRFSEKALLNAARINYVQKKNYDKAYNYYRQLSTNADFKSDALEAAKGMMYSAWYSARYDDAANAANLVLSLNNASHDDQIEAHFYLGKVAYAANDAEKAFNEFSIVSKATSSAIGAESSYRMGEIYFKKNGLKQAEAQCWDVIKKKSGSDYWTAKSYLLLADIYQAQNDWFQAKATLQSVLDNYKGIDDIIPYAKKELDEVKAAEAGSSKLETDNINPEEESIPEEKNNPR